MSNYIGRFAPSPTGLLHIGSLLTAFASYCDAKVHQGKWLVRMEDLDPPREMAGASEHILYTLEAFGFEWDGETLFQHDRHEAYQAAFEQLQAQGVIYPCFCSRKAWQTRASQGLDGFVYDGLCATESPAVADKTPCYRVKTPDETLGFVDRIVGAYQQNLARDIGDFVLLRADGFWAYQLAVVVDDAFSGVTDVVRGQDLLVSTPRQIYLQRLLGLPTPRYAHLPLLTNALGQKWSKQTFAPAIQPQQAEALLREVMSYLALPPAPEVDSLRDLLAWGVAYWSMARVPQAAICTDSSTQ